MNHPFPGNIPVLRRLYQGRFTHVLFLIPFYRSEDPDVITVYRGSYTHAAYLTDARERLQALDYDYLVVVHDDVLLNPKISERTLLDTFQLGPEDGYISHFNGCKSAMGHWTWFYGCAPKALFPKSHLFGGGVEAATLKAYLPPAEDLAAKFEQHGVVPQTHAVATIADFGDVERDPTRTLLHGYAPRISAANPHQADAETHSLAAQRSLVLAMAAANRAALHERGLPTENGDAMELPIPVAISGYFADFYILPKSRFADYAHYIGVASAANLFVEIMVPSLLLACCNKVWTAKDCGLDISGFDRYHEQAAFDNPAFMAIHPFKLSTIKTPEQADHFVSWARQMAEACPYRGGVAQLGTHQFGTHLIDPYATAGWFAPEGWGRWACSRDARLRFVIAPEQSINGVEIGLTAPVNENFRSFGARLVVNGRESGISVDFTPTTSAQLIAIDRCALVSGENQIVVVTDHLVKPREIDPSTTDVRAIGVGITTLRFT